MEGSSSQAIGDRFSYPLSASCRLPRIAPCAIAEDVITRHPNVTWAYRHLAAWAAMNQDMATARWAAQRLLAHQPDFTISRYVAIPVMQNVVRYREAIAAGMKAAGIPEN